MPQWNDAATPEQRARAARYWEEVVSPEMNVRKTAKPKETPSEALERLKAESGKPVAIGDELAKKLAGMKRERAA